MKNVGKIWKTNFQNEWGGEKGTPSGDMGRVGGKFFIFLVFPNNFQLDNKKLPILRVFRSNLLVFSLIFDPSRMRGAPYIDNAFLVLFLNFYNSSIILPE